MGKCFTHTKMDGFLLYADRRMVRYVSKHAACWVSLMPVSGPRIHVSIERQTKSMKLSSNVHTRGTAQENTYSLTHTTVINKIIFKIQTITNDKKDLERLEASGVSGQDRMWCCSENISAVFHVLATHTPHDHQFHS